jgi:hypothetical protein
MAVGYRKRSGTVLFGLPLYDIAVGANPEAGEARGHARGIVAIGDIATGWLAIGGQHRRPAEPRQRVESPGQRSRDDSQR